MPRDIMNVNIFYLAASPIEAASYHCDAHVVKMILESAQLLSTAHRVLDGSRVGIPNPYTKSTRYVWAMSGEEIQVISVLDEKTHKTKYRLSFNRQVCYAATHVNHPCAKWVRESAGNYVWLYALMMELERERMWRFGTKPSKTVVEHGEFLSRVPKNLNVLGFTPPAQAMPEHLRQQNPVKAYRSYYNECKQHLAAWTKRGQPTFMV